MARPRKLSPPHLLQPLLQGRDLLLLALGEALALAARREPGDVRVSGLHAAQAEGCRQRGSRQRRADLRGLRGADCPRRHGPASCWHRPQGLQAALERRLHLRHLRTGPVVAVPCRCCKLKNCREAASAWGPGQGSWVRDGPAHLHALGVHHGVHCCCQAGSGLSAEVSGSGLQLCDRIESCAKPITALNLPSFSINYQSYFLIACLIMRQTPVDAVDTVPGMAPELIA